MKWSYQTCPYPAAWVKTCSAPSVVSARPVFDNPLLDVTRYDSHHDGCDMAIRELEKGKYATMCNSQVEHRQSQDRCKNCKHLNKGLKKLYGPPADGLKKWHDAAKCVGRAVLQLERRIRDCRDSTDAKLLGAMSGTVEYSSNAFKAQHAKCGRSIRIEVRPGRSTLRDCRSLIRHKSYAELFQLQQVSQATE